MLSPLFVTSSTLRLKGEARELLVTLLIGLRQVHKISSFGSWSFRHDTHRLGLAIRSGLISVPSSRKNPNC